MRFGFSPSSSKSGKKLPSEGKGSGNDGSKRGVFSSYRSSKGTSSGTDGYEANDGEYGSYDEMNRGDHTGGYSVNSTNGMETPPPAYPGNSRDLRQAGDDISRDALFGDRRGASGIGQVNRAARYGNYNGDRELTAEEKEEEDVEAVKDQIRDIKRQDVASTRNALRLAEQAYQTGSETLTRLGAQGERLFNTERNVDLASNQNRIASEKTSELKTLNRSMFAVHVGNPFSSEKRRQEADRRILETHQRERDERQRIQASAYESQARMERTQRDLRDGGRSRGGANEAAERMKYQFEADSEDEAMESEINENLGSLEFHSGRLNKLAQAIGREVDSQNQQLNRLNVKIDKVDDEITMNRNRLNRIR